MITNLPAANVPAMLQKIMLRSYLNMLKRYYNCMEMLSKCNDVTCTYCHGAFIIVVFRIRDAVTKIFSCSSVPVKVQTATLLHMQTT